MDDWVALASAETIAILRSAGLAIESWAILSQSNRLVLDLQPCRLIAKAVRIGARDRLARELAVARHVVAHAGPSARPASPSGPLQAATIAVTVWEPIVMQGIPSEHAIGRAYTELRGCLDSFAQRLPDFREALEAANALLKQTDLTGMSEPDSSFMRAWFDRALSRLASFQWQPHALHGDPHSGNVALTPDGPRWFDLESVCSGPIEWDLSALPTCARTIDHDRDLLAVLTILRRLCVVTWCASKKSPTPSEAEAITHHLAALKEATAVDRPTTV
jgi:hypothetical protein